MSEKWIFFTPHTVGLGHRRNSTIFWADAASEAGIDTLVVTVQLSLASLLMRRSRVTWNQRSLFNAPYPVAEKLTGCLWVCAVHPLSIRTPWLEWAGRWLFRLYDRQLPGYLKERIRAADVAVVESSCAIALVPQLRRLNPRLKIVYNACDRLGTSGFSGVFQSELEKCLALFNLVRVPARAMQTEFESAARTVFIPQGISKRILDEAREEVGRDGGRRRPRIVVAGDMLMDWNVIGTIAAALPDCEIHVFGRIRPADRNIPANIHLHGEVPFEELARHMAAADAGLAPYRVSPDMDYLVDSSLKLKQYTYAGMAIVAPEGFGRGARHIYEYDPANPDSILSATQAALAHDADSVFRDDILDWSEVFDALRQEIAAAGSTGAAAYAGAKP